jgi:cyclopropane fatty-acyl-phospholipid synthase-like methyltransferase
MTSRISVAELAAYYESKTLPVLRRYGPGPRVHYHTGLIDAPARPAPSARAMRQQLVSAQERMLYHAAEVWRAKSVSQGEVLDVGCGLGGGAIFWAQEFGSAVTAVTIAPSHVQLVARFAAQAGVEAQVRPLLCDALEVAGEARFDTVIAIDSSSHLPRKAWFERVAVLLRPGGRVFVADNFLERSKYEGPINSHWCARIGRIAEYLAAAREAGLREELLEDISRRTEQFWSLTLALIREEAQQNPSVTRSVEFEKSLALHGLMQQGLTEGGLRYALMSFSKAY